MDENYTQVNLSGSIKHKEQDIFEPNVYCPEIYVNPLYLAVQGNDYKAVKLLLRHNQGDVNVGDGSWTPLHQSVSNNNVKLVKLLIRFRANVNTMAMYIWHTVGNSTPLHTAVCHSVEPAILKILLLAGADVHLKDDFQENPLDKAVKLYVQNCMNRYWCNHKTNRCSDDLSMLFILLCSGAELSGNTNMFTLASLENCLIQKEQWNFIALLWQSGYKFTRTNTKISYKKLTIVPEMYGLLSDHNRNVLTLQDICSRVIRQTMRCNAVYGCKQLELPNAIQEIILVSDF